jgi:hypothetical protein
MMNPPERRELRISDVERDHVASILRDAAGDGRLDLQELDERLDAVYAAKTYGDLEPITRDLPATSVSPSAARTDRTVGAAPTSTVAVGIMSGFERKGPWVVPETFTAVAFWGGGELDLREASFSGPQVTIRAWAVMGGIEIIVPEDAEVHVNGVGIMGGFDHRASGAGAGGPRIIVTGLAFWGGVSVERKPSDAELKRRKEERKLQKRERRRRLEE